jgi:hypothetical protein
MKMKRIVRGETTLTYNVLSNGGGMSGVVRCFGIEIACQYIGRYKAWNISKNYCEKSLPKALQYAKDLFLEVLFEETDSDWLELNHTMYANEV